MSNVVDSRLIFLDEEMNSKEEIMQTLANRAYELGFTSSAKDYIEALWDREAEMSTAIGYDLAIPHGKTNAIQTPFIIFLRLKHNVKWNEEQTVKMVFMLGIPGEGAEKEHLTMLSKIARKLMHDDFREKLLVESNADEVYRLLSDIEI